MNELRADEVAELDPYGVRNKGAKSDAKDLLGDQVTEPEPLIEKPKLSQLYKIELKEWKKALGHKVEVTTLPETVTDEVRDVLEKEGFELRYLPSLSLGHVGWLNRIGVEDLRRHLSDKYPNWKNIPEDWYWEQVGKRYIDFPYLPGMWVAVENVKMPTLNRPYYDRRPFTEKFIYGSLGRDWSWDSIYSEIDIKGKGQLAELGITRDAHLRFPDFIEWNILNLRDNWSAGAGYEWTDSSYLGDDKTRVGGKTGPFALITGRNEAFGQSTNEPNKNTGFRLMIVFDKEHNPPPRVSKIITTPSGQINIVGAFEEMGETLKERSINKRRDRRFSDFRKPQPG